MKRNIFIFALALLAALARADRPPVPVYGPARIAVDDGDLLATTILDVGTIAMMAEEPGILYVGDGLTPGGIPCHAKGCITNFAGVSVATTNLDMKSWSIKWGPWQAHGDANEWDLGYGTAETWLRFLRNSGQAYLAYDFTIIDSTHYRFSLAWAETGHNYPVLQVSTNLAEGYFDADPADLVISRLDSTHLEIEYAVPFEDYVSLSFRLFAPTRLDTGAYFSVPVHADYGLAAVGSVVVTGRVESYHDEQAGEDRDRYVPGSITIDGEEVATTGAVVAVAADLAAHQSASNPHGITAAGIGALTAETDSAALSALGVASNALREAIAGHAADTNNPHRTTPDGIGMDDWLSEHGIQTGALQGEGIAAIKGYGHYLGLEDWVWMLPGAFDGDFTMWSTNKTWNFQTPEPPKWNGAPLATLAAVSDAVAVVQGAATTNAGNIATNAAAILAVSNRVDTLANTVSDIDSDYLTSADAAGFATTQAVASIERRTSALEGSTSEYWCKWTDASLSASGTNWIPTNWPARTVYCFLSCDNAVYNVYLPNWTPDDECTLYLRVLKTATGTIVLRTAFGVALASMTSSSAIYREFEIVYRKGAGWVVSFLSLASVPYVVDGGTRQAIEESALPEGGDFAPVVIE